MARLLTDPGKYPSPSLSEVTAVITTHARPQFVHEALASVCAETHGDLECVIVDDGATFELRGLSANIEVRVVRGERLGVGGARNLGLAAARGEFVIFLDDDDVALPNRITTLLGAARRSGADLCFGMTRRAVGGAAGILPHVPTGMEAGPVGFCDVLTCVPHVNSVLVRTSALREIGGFDVEARHFDDWAAWLRLADRNAVLWCVRDVVAEWRLHGEGLTGKLLHAGAMKSRLIALFERLQPDVSAGSAQAIAIARQVVASSEIDTYDDYVHAMTQARAPRSASAPRSTRRRPAPPSR
jgi:glycosyltransferase involved in cell wall biosynthesis